MQKCHACNKPLIFCSENNGLPFPNKADEFLKRPTARGYLNSGGFIGYVGAFREAYRAVNPS